MIDRKKVFKGLECCSDMTVKRRHKCLKECPYDFIHNENCMGDMARDALELLREQPEQKPGHWKGFTQSRYFGTDDDGEPIFRDGVFYVCSECRRKSIIRYPYCPKCGAKMDEEVKQND